MQSLPSQARRLNREASRQSLVLLQNRRGVLPLKRPRPPATAAKPVVVIGPSANSSRLLGGGHYARQILPSDGFPSVPGAIRALLGPRATVRWEPGIRCSARSDSVCVDPQPDAALRQAAVSQARGASQVVLLLGLQSREPCDSDAAYSRAGGEFNPCGYESEQHDRGSTALPKLQQELALAVLAATKAAGVPCVVVLVHGGALAIEAIKAAADGILDAHYPGEATGAQAVAQALYGDFSPGGKLSYSVMPAAFTGLSDFTSFSMSEPPGRTYWYYPTSPASMPPVLWPFGWGLTYSHFNISLADPARPYSFLY